MNTEAAQAITDAESCSKLAGNADTIGNMYLLADGACVQSFKNAEFDATLEEKDDGTLGQTWELSYTST